MRAGKWILRSALLVGLLIAGLVVVVYVLISQVPEHYDPPLLSRTQKKAAAKRFVAKGAEFHNKAAVEPDLRWLATEDELNQYLASMDEIVAYRVGGKPGDVSKKLARLGLSGPAIELSPGRMWTLSTARAAAR